MTRAPIAPTVDSPCVGVCRIDEAAGCCAGCARTIDEIVAWGRADRPTRLAVLEAARARREAAAAPPAAQPRRSPGPGGGIE